MRHQKLFAAALLFQSQQIPSAHTVEEAHRYFPLRRDAVLAATLSHPLGEFDRANGRKLTIVSMARLERGSFDQIVEVNLRLLDPKLKPFGEPGTDFHALGPICERTGDYDFALLGLTLLTARYWDQPGRLWPTTRDRILDELLTERGGTVEKSRRLGLCGWWPETENHILLTEISQYITNQLLQKRLAQRSEYDPRFDNRRNGMDEFFLRHLQRFLIEDFDEFNSRPYQKLTTWALTALYEHAQNPRVKLASQMVLDYLAAKYAASSKSGRRSVPFRRQPQYRFEPDLVRTDSENLRFALYAGNLDHFDEALLRAPLEAYPQVLQSLASYRVPDLILDLVLRDEAQGREFWQGFHHSAWEVYAGSPSFLLSGGGRHVNAFDGATGSLTAWAVPTVLIPASGGTSRDQMIRFEGSTTEAFKNNLCVAPGFACGTGLRIPPEILRTCSFRPMQDTQWTFLDLTSPGCSSRWGFYVAIHEAGFLEAAETHGRSFDEFMQSVLESNSARSFSRRGINRYRSSRGIEIEFVPDPFGFGNWGILRYGDRRIEMDDTQWPLAWGDLMEAHGDGRVWIRNPYLGTELELDYRDPLHPRRN